MLKHFNIQHPKKIAFVNMTTDLGRKVSLGKLSAFSKTLILAQHFRLPSATNTASCFSGRHRLHALVFKKLSTKRPCLNNHGLSASHPSDKKNRIQTWLVQFATQTASQGPLLKMTTTQQKIFMLLLFCHTECFLKCILRLIFTKLIILLPYHGDS